MALAGSCLASETQLTFPDLFGNWKVRKLVGMAPITAGDLEERQPLGRTITISAQQIVEPWRQPACRPRHPALKLVDTKEELEQNWRVSISDLDLRKGWNKPRMQIMDVGCADALVLDRNNLVWPSGNGFYYLAIRQRNTGP